MIKIYLLALIMLVSATMIEGAIYQYYTFSQETATYSTIEGTILPALAVDDALSGPIDLGFTFPYGLTSYTQVKISSNGWIGLGTEASAPQIMNELVGFWVNWSTIAPLWDDISLLGGSCHYLTEGTVPNRIFKVQYTNAKWYYGATNQFNFQVWMHETGKIEFVYGNSVGNPVSASASIGINMLPHNGENFLSVTPGNPATASYLAEDNLVSTFPGNGIKYVFNPVAQANNDLMAVSITGNSTPTQGVGAIYQITVQNVGSNAQSDYLVNLMSGTQVLASIAGPTLVSGQSQSVALSWTPVTAGLISIYGKVLLTGDENPLNDSTFSIDIVVQEQGITAVTIGSGDQLDWIPVNMNARNSLFETIYLASEMNSAGLITGVSFYNNFVTNLPNKPTKIWLGSASQSNLAADWIPSSALTQVFNGNVTYPSGTNMVTIQFPVAYLYAGGNLVMMVNRPMDTSSYDFSDMFLCQTEGTNRSRYTYSSSAVLNPANPPDDNVDISGLFPKTTFYLSPTGVNPQISIYPDSVDFGTVYLDNQVSQLITIYNTGSSALSFTDISLAGSPFYSLTDVPSVPVFLAGMQSIQFVCHYNPITEGHHTGTITITDNQTRNVYTISLSADCLSPNITTSPYFQNFDTAVPPDLPVNWNKLIVPSGTGATVTVEDGGAYSEPNYAMLSNQLTTAANLYLISPKIDESLDLNSMRVRFFARGFFPTSSIQVGIISNITDQSTFTLLSTMNVTSNWTEFGVSFSSYTGTGRYVAFKHGNSNHFEAIHIDNVTIETTPLTDMAALDVSGNVTPTVNIASDYHVNIFNYGTSPQSDYVVKLFREGDIEVSSVAGPLINPGSSALVSLSWTPLAEGSTYIYGRIVLASDENSFNDQTPNYHVMVHPAGSILVTVGSGDQTANIPVDMRYQNSLFETIYLSSELNFVGMITAVSFYNDFEANLLDMPTNVWLGITSLPNLTENWITSTDLTPVFSGTVSYYSGQNFITINLTQPFPYNYQTGNLVMMVERPWDNVFYNQDNLFYAQDSNTNRSRNVWSNIEDLDPSSPPINNIEVSGLFPKTSFSIIPSSLGNVTGTVYGAAGLPLNNATVMITNVAQTTTDATGYYLFENLIASSYDVTVSRNGYYPQTVNVTVVEDSTTTQNFTLLQMPTVSVTGTVVGSDDPTTGLSNAIITLSDYETYQVTTDAQGHFFIPGVYANQSYQYTASAIGYQVYIGDISVGSTDYNLGNIILSEIAYMPRNVTANLVTNPASVVINWQAPDPGTTDMDNSFEDAIFPPSDWSRIVTNNGPPNIVGVNPTWCRVGTINNGDTTIAPTDGDWQAGLWWDYNHQDEWLISPLLNCPQNAWLNFDTSCFYGSLNGDHYYVRVSSDNGTNWNILWDASALTGGLNNYQSPVHIDLSDYYGQQIKLAWHAEDPPDNSGMWYNWFIDNVSVSNSQTSIRFDLSSMTRKSYGSDRYNLQAANTKVQFSKADDVVYPIKVNASPLSIKQNQSREMNRTLLGYKVWRLLQGQEQNELLWTLLTLDITNGLSYSDITVAGVPNGIYKWAVKAIYTNDVSSLAAFSNPVTLAEQSIGTLAGVVRNASNIPIIGATITAGVFSATSNAVGYYSMPVATGTYAVTCSAPGYQPVTIEDIVITMNQTTACNFTMTVGNTDPVQIASTRLRGNFPNPFNAMTTINFDVKNTQKIKVEIYNIKGQFIRTLVDEPKNSGRYSIIWDGRDEFGKAVASGIYHCRMQSSEYRGTHKMILFK